MEPKIWYQVYYTRNGDDWRVVGYPFGAEQMETYEQALMEAVGLERRNLFPAKATMSAKMETSVFSDLATWQVFSHTSYTVLTGGQR